MIVGGGVGDAEIDDDVLEESRIGQRDSALPEIRADGECQTVATRAQRIAFEQRRVGAAVAVGRHRLDPLVAVTRAAVERHRHPGGGPALRGVEHMRRQMPQETFLPASTVFYAHPLAPTTTTMASAARYPRDMIGYGAHPPHPRWPGGARIALQIVLNYEEGAERSVLHGDATAETFLSEIVDAQPFPARHMSMESLYEYGSRAGVWRLLRVFRERRLPVTVFGVALALERNPAAVEAMLENGHEIACHGWRWISYQQVDENTEREHVARAVETIARLTGRAPDGWYTGRDSPNTRRLVVEHGGFVYDADAYADDLPYWVEVETRAGAKPHLVVPYALDSNDMRFATPQGFNSGAQFFDYLRDAFDVLYAEGDPAGLDAPKMMSVGLHCRIAGRPGRIAALARFLDHVARHDAVWVARRIDIARHWISTHPYGQAA